MIRKKEYYRLAAINHVMFGALVILLPMVYRWCPWWWMLIWILLFAWKEFYYDLHDERPEIRGSDVDDFIQYMAGMLIGIAISLPIWMHLVVFAKSSLLITRCVGMFVS